MWVWGNVAGEDASRVRVQDLGERWQHLSASSHSIDRTDTRLIHKIDVKKRMQVGCR